MKTWIDEATAQLDQLTNGGEHLDALAAEAPRGAAAFAALRSVYDALDLHDAISAPLAAEDRFGRPAQPSRTPRAALSRRLSASRASARRWASR